MPPTQGSLLFQLRQDFRTTDSMSTAKAQPTNQGYGEAGLQGERAILALRSGAVGAVLVFFLGAALLEWTPGLQRFRLFLPIQSETSTAKPVPLAELTVGETALQEESHVTTAGPTQDSQHAPRSARGPIAAHDETVDAPAIDLDTKAPPVPLLDPSGHALDAFYAALARTARREPGAITRIVHFGDSIVASDYVSGTLRRKLQESFGDSGHGFTLIANAWPAYFHEGISRYATRGFSVSRVVGPVASDGWHGLGGVSFKAPPHTLARIGTAPSGNQGRSVSRFILGYVQQPQGGTLEVRIDGQSRGTLSTDGPVKRFQTAEWQVPDGEHQLELQTTRGTSRFFGVVLERDQPGVVLDAIGIQGARMRFLDKQDEAHFAEQLRWRNPQLLVYQFGANESADGYAVPMPEYHASMKAVLLKHRRALPQASCLVVGVMDRASRSGDTLKSSSIIPLLLAEQEQVAKEVGCAFFDTYRAMGGQGSMPRWVKRGLGQADLTHPSAVGSEILGTWLYRALLQGRGPGATVPAAAGTAP